MHKRTLLRVDEDLCVGCGICADACPMKILIVHDRQCSLADDTICLECGTCVHECPKNALSIEEDVKEGENANESELVSLKGDHTKGKVQFTPILEALNQLLQELSPVQLYNSEGRDISDFDDFEIGGEKCYARVYEAPKVEKIGIAKMNFFGLMTANVLSIRPAPAYDIPSYIMDWDESEDHIFFICDLLNTC